MIRWFTRLVRNLRIIPRWVIIMIDLSLIALSCLIGYLLRFNFVVTDLIHYNFEKGVLLYTACGLLAIVLTDSYKGIIRYTGIQDGVRIFVMVVLNLVLVFITSLVSVRSESVHVIPYSVIFITFLSSFLLLFNYRLLVKYVFSYYKYAVLKKSRILIYGAGQTGIITRHVVSASHRMRVIGFLEDDNFKVGKVIDGVKIYGARQPDLVELLKELAADEVIITAKDFPLDRKNELVDACLNASVKIRTVPPVEKWVRGELSINQIKDVNIEDLLGRETIQLNNEAVRQDLLGKRICVTGASGSIGSELVRQLIQCAPERLILIDQAESPLYELEREMARLAPKVRIFSYLADITNQDRVRSIFQEHRPEIVYHAAAYKHVPVMESNPSEAVTCNILGTKSLADIAIDLHVQKFVMISTDKAVNPTNVMGCSKRIAEIYVQALNNHLLHTNQHKTSFVTTRFGNVLGSNGSVIPLFKRQIEMGGPVTVTHPEITRFFMTIPEACQLVLEAGTMGKGGEIFIFDMGKSVKILDLARRMIQLSGMEPGRDVEIVFTGLREGEKLYEELLNQSENTLPTHHEKIMIAKVRSYEYEEVNRYVDLFHELVNDRNELKMVALMKELVPEYRSNYSRYEVLDSK
ncbi:MAG: polysaccharide biosynthesis protein [Cyclobacteriaceae bacterium]|nr:polysaccharide biosynthesis protein [Cyclobacteriaceae bacterium]